MALYIVVVVVLPGLAVQLQPHVALVKMFRVGIVEEKVSANSTSERRFQGASWSWYQLVRGSITGSLRLVIPPQLIFIEAPFNWTN